MVFLGTEYCGGSSRPVVFGRLLDFPTAASVDCDVSAADAATSLDEVRPRMPRKWKSHCVLNKGGSLARNAASADPAVVFTCTNQCGRSSKPSNTMRRKGHAEASRNGAMKETGRRQRRSWKRVLTRTAAGAATAFLGAATILHGGLSGVSAANPQCLTADAMIGGMRHYLVDWDQQLLHGANKTWTCEDFAQFLYNSRDRIQQELFYTYSNMTTVPTPKSVAKDGGEGGGEQDEVVSVSDAELPEGFGDLPWILSHVNKAASLVSASVHVNSGLGVIRQECFVEPAVHLLFFVSLRRVHQLMLNQLKYLWYLMQNTPEMYRGAATQWIMEASQVFRGDLDTTESIFEGWNPPNSTISDENPLTYEKHEKPKVFSIVELLRRQTFKETDFDRELVRATMRHVFSKNDIILELGAGTGDLSRWLNETGWVQSHAYDYSSDIELITFNNVHQLRADNYPPRLGDGDIPYDWILCLSEQCPMMLEPIQAKFSNLRDYTHKGVILQKDVLGVSDISPALVDANSEAYVEKGLAERYAVLVHAAA
ncbi:unnamed protein product [Amoebophrya sp. A120]|nr:unnamed protein product [Amoebophrya sp. A120]|eukprot:GSA120T00016770001.1